MAKSSSASDGASSSKSLLFMMIAMTCGFSILLGGALLMTSRVIMRSDSAAGSDKTTVRTPLGEFRVEKAREVGPRPARYPAAALVLRGSADAHVPLDDDRPQVMASITTRRRPANSSASWYLEHLSPEFARQDSGPKKLPPALRDSQISDDDIAFVGERGDQVRAVSLATEDTGTKITLLRSFTKAPTPAPASPSPTSSTLGPVLSVEVISEVDQNQPG